MLRVGMFTEVFHPIHNGVVASIDTLCAALQHDGIDVTTYAPFFPRSRNDARDIVRFPSLPLPTRSGYRLCIPYLSPRERERTRALDIVHAHSPFVSGWFAFWLARHLHVPLVYTYHTRFDDYAHYVPLRLPQTRAALVALTRAFANRADAVVVPTEAMRARLRAIGVTSAIAVVPSAIDRDRFARGVRSDALRALLGARADDKLALVVARLGREKNVELAIDALAFTAANVQLAIVGDGPSRARLEGRARRRGVHDRVRFCGALAPEVLPDVYASSDALAFTSRTETQGLVLAEALAAGLPIAAADSPVAREVAPIAAWAGPGPRGFARALETALGSGRGERSAADRFAPGRFAAAMQSVYASAQSAVHLAL